MYFIHNVAKSRAAASDKIFMFKRIISFEFFFRNRLLAAVVYEMQEIFCADYGLSPAHGVFCFVRHSC